MNRYLLIGSVLLPLFLAAAEPEGSDNSFLREMMPELRNRTFRGARVIRRGAGSTGVLLRNGTFRGQLSSPSAGNAGSGRIELRDIPDPKKVKTLDLRKYGEVVLDGTLFPELESLKLGSNIRDLDRLNMPKLKELTLSLRSWPPVERQAPLKLAVDLPALEKIFISAATADFDYGTLAGRKLKEVTVTGYDGEDVDFLRDQPVEKLRIASGPKLKDLSVLAQMPLKVLELGRSVRPEDYTFLRELRLEELRMVVGSEKFDPNFLEKMPLKKLYLMNSSKFDGGDWTCLEGKPLRELALAGFRISEKSFAVFGQSSLRSLFLQQVYTPDPRMLFSDISKNENLQNFYCVNLFKDDSRAKTPFWNPPWELLSKVKLTSLVLCVYGDLQLHFLRDFSSLRNLKLIFPRNAGKVDLAPLRELKLERLFIFGLPDAEAKCREAGLSVVPGWAFPFVDLWSVTVIGAF